MYDNKSYVRQKALQMRNMLKPAEIEHMSEKIAARLTDLFIFKKSFCIMCYVDFKSEVRTRNLIKESLALGKRVAVPLIVGPHGGEREIEACEIRDIESELTKGTYGIMEPRPESARRVDPLDIDIAVVPGVAFDMGKNRIGYGKGYYDRFLAKTRKECVKIGLAFEVQVVEEIPPCEGDIPMDMIITEERIII